MNKFDLIYYTGAIDNSNEQIWYDDVEMQNVIETVHGEIKQDIDDSIKITKIEKIMQNSNMFQTVIDKERLGWFYWNNQNLFMK